MGGIWAILALTAAVYAPALGATFHFDDYAIFADPYVTAPDGWWQVFRPGQTRPLTYFTFWLNCALGGSEPWGYHAFNVAAHLGTAGVAWTVFRRILEVPAAWFATAVFALHPLQTEAVAYVFARAAVLATLFCLLSWRSWLDERHWRAAGWFAIALLAKEEAVAFPLFLLITDWFRARLRRESIPAAAVMLGASIAAGVRLLMVAAASAGSGLGGHSPFEYLLTQAKVIARYLQLFLMPVGQNFDHDVKIFSAGDAAGWAALVGLAALLALAARRRKQMVWWLGALVLLAPTSSIFPLADLMFEHRMYLPLISLSAAVGLLTEKAARLRRQAVRVALTLALAGATWNRTQVWSTEVTLWSDAAAKSPAKLRPKLQLARALAATDPDRAETLLLEAQRLAPENPEPFTQMGTLMLDRRRPGRALREFEAALRLAPHSADALSNRGAALYVLGRPAEAEDEFRRALDRDPCHFNARHNLLLLYRARGDDVSARQTKDVPPGCRFTPAQVEELRN
jgi:Flp pilus assembly protein TadD